MEIIINLPIEAIDKLASTSKTIRQSLDNEDVLSYLSHKYNVEYSDSYNGLAKNLTKTYPCWRSGIYDKLECIKKIGRTSMKHRLVDILSFDEVIDNIYYFIFTQNPYPILRYKNEVIRHYKKNNISPYTLLLIHNDELVKLVCDNLSYHATDYDGFEIAAGPYAHYQLTGDRYQLDLVIEAFELDEWEDREFLLGYCRDYDYAEYYIERYEHSHLFGTEEEDLYISYLAGKMSREEAEEEEYNLLIEGFE